MNFPYIEFLGLSEERIFRPMIPIIFKANKKEFKTYSLIDSGSDYTILPIEIATILNLDISNEPRFNMLGAGGNCFIIYKSPIKIQFNIQKNGFKELHWKSYVYFAESGTTILLGQNGFLDQCKVLFNGTNKTIEILK